MRAENIIGAGGKKREILLSQEERKKVPGSERNMSKKKRRTGVSKDQSVFGRRDRIPSRTVNNLREGRFGGDSRWALVLKKGQMQLESKPMGW